MKPVVHGYRTDEIILQKGFGEEETEANAQEKIEAYCDQFGKINAVRMRRGDIEGKGAAGKGKGQFKVRCYASLGLRLSIVLNFLQGSVFVEFAYEADAKKFAEQESIPKFTSDGPEMTFMSKFVYFGGTVSQTKN